MQHRSMISPRQRTHQTPEPQALQPPLAGRVATAALVLWGISCFATSADAAVDTRVSASASYDDYSNVFALAPGATPVFGGPGAPHGDSSLGYAGSVQSDITWGAEKLTLRVNGSHTEYQRYHELDHTEHTEAADLAWRATHAIDGSLSVSNAHTMVPFYDAATTELLLQTLLVGTGKVNVALSPRWLVRASDTQQSTDSPRPGFPNLRLNESQSELDLLYTGQDPVSSGLAAIYASGAFRGVSNTSPPTYHQLTLAWTTDYIRSSFSTFHASLGYADRTINVSDTGTDHLAGLTGSLSYQRTLTGKTTLHLAVGRNISTSITTLGPSFDTTAGGEIEYSPIRTLSFTLGREWIRSSYELPVFFAGPQQARRDSFTTSGLQANYRPLHNLTIRGYVRRQDRGSTIAAYSFTGTTTGIALELTWP